MDIGADMAGIKTKVAVDNWGDACASLKGYFGDRIQVIEQDISQITDPLSFWQNVSGEINKPNIIFGDPPCQAFSQAGKQKGLQDQRGSMIYEFLRWLVYCYRTK